MCQYRLAIQVATQVVGQFLRRAVAAIDILVHRLGDDAFQVGAESRRTAVAFAVFQRRGLQRLAQRSRLRLANRTLGIGRTQPGQFVWPDTGQQLVQDHAQRIHIRARAGRLPLHLLRACISRRHRGQRGQ